MGIRRVERGPAADRTAQNIRQLREERRLTLDNLSDRMRQLGRPILKSGLAKIESGERRVDVDDLVALAIALETNVNRLLLPADASHDEVDITPELKSSTRAAWAWSCGEFVAGAGQWPWARFVDEGRLKAALKRFLDEAHPHDPPPYLSADEWSRLQPWVEKMTGVYAEMRQAGLSETERLAVARIDAQDTMPFVRTDDGDSVKDVGRGKHQ